MVQHSDPRPYMQIAARLRSQIADGCFTAGQPIPSITVLCEQYGYSRQTISKGLRVLEREGILCRIRGLEYHVYSPSLSPLVVPPPVIRAR
jgi:DNA-binding GntR family transcriptional regulator